MISVHEDVANHDGVLHRLIDADALAEAQHETASNLTKKRLLVLGSALWVLLLQNRSQPFRPEDAENLIAA